MLKRYSTVEPMSSKSRVDMNQDENGRDDAPAPMHSLRLGDSEARSSAVVSQKVAMIASQETLSSKERGGCIPEQPLVLEHKYVRLDDFTSPDKDAHNARSIDVVLQ